MLKKSTFMYLAAAIALGGGSVARADTIGIQTEGDYAQVPMSGSTAGGNAGVVGLSNSAWNIYSDSGTGGSSATVLDNNGASTGASVSWADNGSWSSIGSATQQPNPDSDLMDSFINHPNATTPASVTVTGIPASYTSSGKTYSVYVYFGAQGNGTAGAGSNSVSGNGQFTITPTGGTATNYYVATDDARSSGTNFDTSPGFVNGSASTTAGTYVSSNYVLVSGLTASSFTVSDQANSNGGPPGIHGLEIVSAPEPSSLAVVGLGALGLIARRRRARGC